MAQGLEALGVGPGRDHAVIVGGAGVEVVVVCLQPGLFQSFCLLTAEHPQGTACLHAQGGNALDHLKDALKLRAFAHLTPGGPEAEAGAALSLCGTGGFQDRGHRLQSLFGQPGGVVGTLRTVGAVFGTATGLDAQQGAELDVGGVEILAVDGLGAPDQL